MTRWNRTPSLFVNDTKCATGCIVQQELEDAEFIPMPEDCNLPTPDQLASFSESITLPYEELKELKAAAAAVGSRNGLAVNANKPRFASVSMRVTLSCRPFNPLLPKTKRMTSGKVNGLEETNICSKGDPVRCCRASTEVAQVLQSHTTNESK